MRKAFLITLAFLAFLSFWRQGAAYAASPAVNLIGNPSVETASASDATMPAGWEQDSWGTNTPTFEYLANGGHDGSRSLKVTMQSYTDGDAKWFFDAVPASPSTNYTYSDFYQSTAYSEALVMYIDSDGNRSFDYLGLVKPHTPWKKWTVTFETPSNVAYMTVLHILDDVGYLQTDTYSLIQGSVDVSVTKPVAGATVSCTSNLVTKLTGVAGSVQFQVDGNNVGDPIAQAPYKLAWNSLTVADGIHMISSVTTDANGNEYAAAPVMVTVANQPTASDANLVVNGSAETVGCDNKSIPLSWSKDTYGTNDAKFTYLKTGAHTGSRALQTTMTTFTDGDGKWLFDPIAVQPNSLYTYTEWYQTNATDQEITVIYYHTDGTRTYEYIINPTLSADWAKFSVTITTYADTQSISVMHTLNSVGFVSIDDISLTPYSPVGFNQGIVSLTFDDGSVSPYTNALSVLDQYHMKATWYLVPGFLNTDTYMTDSQVMTLKDDGMELGAHSMTHPDLTSLSAADLQTELAQSQADIQSKFGVTVDDFASPFGLYNATTIAAIQQYYTYHRTTDVGYNSKDSLDVYHIKVQNITADTTPAMVQEWVNQAMSTKTWLVLVYHEVGAATPGTFNITAADFASHMQIIADSGIAVETMDQALAEIKPQM